MTASCSVVVHCGPDGWSSHSANFTSWTCSMSQSGLLGSRASSSRRFTWDGDATSSCKVRASVGSEFGVILASCHASCVCYLPMPQHENIVHR
jgi:hypothetical protein